MATLRGPKIPNSLLSADRYDGITRKFYRNSKNEICCLTDREVFVYEKLHKSDTYRLLELEEYTDAMKVLYGNKEG